MWTICAFRVLNPRQWSLTKQSSLKKSWTWITQKCQNSWSQKGWCNKPTILQFQSILTWKILMLSKHYESTEVDRRTWLYVPSGTHWSTSSGMTMSILWMSNDNSATFMSLSKQGAQRATYCVQCAIFVDGTERPDLVFWSALKTQTL